ncbi:MAG: hypothetical protein E6Q88_06850 [Lysobacteraceae bacterium]|nr:MAG: hypothetical protein E6Q88_06850 [Xanthomonadaceae bacterium]
MSSSNKPPLWFWLISLIMLAWNLMGVSAYVGQVTITPAELQAMPEIERAQLLSMPGWAVAAFACAVFGGAAGCLLLLLRSRWAPAMLALSLIGVLVQLGHAFLIAKAYAVFGPGGLIMPVMVLAGAVFLLWFALRVRRRGWLR